MMLLNLIEVKIWWDMVQVSGQVYLFSLDPFFDLCHSFKLLEKMV